MIFGVTERPEYKRCRRRWDLGSRNRQGLMPIVPDMALGLGTLVHGAFEAWAGDSNTSLEVHFLKYANARIEEVRTAYRENVGTSPTDSDIGSLLEGVVLGRAMMANYQAYWKTLVPDGYEIVANEQRIQVAIPGTEHTSEWLYDRIAQEPVLVKYPDVRMHYLEGRLDQILRNQKTGYLYVRDYKTYSNRPNEEDLFHNDQFIAYTWIAYQLDIGPVAGLAYDGIWKRAAVPGKVDGRKGTLSDLFCRIRIERPIDEVQQFEKLLALEAMEMAGNPAIYTNHMWDGSCRWGCKFKDLCYAMDRGEDVEYTKSRKYMIRPQDADDSNEEAA